MSYSRLNNSTLRHPYRGVRSELPPPETIEARCREYAPLLRQGEVFSHLTAGRLWGCPLPGDLAREPLHTTVPRPERAQRSRGTTGHQASPTTVTTAHNGFPLTDPASTWLGLAALLSLDDLVACGDYLAHDPRQLDPHDIRPHTDVATLADRTRAFNGRGARRARTALNLLVPASASRRETHLRLLLNRAMLPEPEVNVDIFDDRGQWLAIGDLVFARYKVLVEYDGDQHRTSTLQYERDMRRVENLIEAGWIVIRIRRHGRIIDPRDTVARVTRALMSRGWAPR